MIDPTTTLSLSLTTLANESGLSGDPAHIFIRRAMDALDGRAPAPAPALGGAIAQSVATLATNTAPVAQNDQFLADEDTAEIVPVLDNDTDAEGQALMVTAVDTANTTGVVTLDAGTVTYDPEGEFEFLPFGGQVVDTFQYTIEDTEGATGTARVTLLVLGVNDAPVAAVDAFSTDEDTPIVDVDVLGNDSDVDTNDTRDVTNVSSALSGAATLNADGTVSYSPDGQFDDLQVGQSRTDSFDYTITDSQGATSTTTVTITVNGVNDAPVAADDTAATTENASLAAIDVLANDSDLDTGDSLTLTAVDTTGTLGTASLGAGGGIDYDPGTAFDTLAAGDTDTDSFNYTVTDSQGATGTATVVVTITGENDAPVGVADSLLTNEDTATASIDLAANDIDVDSGDTLGVTAVDTTGTTGTVAFDPAMGTVVYDPAGQFDGLSPGESATDSFSYTVTDSQGAESSATATVTITGLNDAPTAADDAASTDEDTEIASVDLLGNDSDPDASDTISVVSVNGAGTIGTVTLTDGVVSYDPDGQFENLGVGASATDSFAYVISDSNGATSSATATITITGVNDGPLAVDDTATIDEDTLLDDLAVLDNDSDPDSADVLSIIALDVTGTVGNVEIDGTDVIDYDPADVFDSLAAGQTATDTFSYTIQDTAGATSSATVTITVTGKNDGPTAVVDALSTDEDTPTAPIDLAANDIDPDTGDELTVTAVDETGTQGAVTLNAGGTVVYDPDGQFETLASGVTETDSFAYTVTDSAGATSTATATVTITGVNDAPVAEDDTATTDEETPLPGIAVLSNDTDIDGDSLTVSLAAGNGFSLGAGNTIDFDPTGLFDQLAVGATDTTSVVYTVTDLGGASATATLTVTVTGVNDTPIASADTATTDEDTAIGVDVLANDSDIDGDDLVVLSVDGSATSGRVTLVDGTITYDPNGQFDSLAEGEMGNDSFSYTVSDGQGGTATATVTVVITGVNDAPDAANDVAITDEESDVIISVLANDIDVDGDALMLDMPAIDDTGTVGLVTANADGTVTYTPNGAFEDLGVGQTATDSFSYQVTDGKGGNDSAVVTVTITGVNDDPNSADDTVTTTEAAAVDVDVLANDGDIDGDPLTLGVLDDSGTIGTVGPNGNLVRYDPNGQFEGLAVGATGLDSFGYEALDGQGGTSNGQVTVFVQGLNDLPVAVADFGETTEDMSVLLAVLDNDSDPDGDALALQSIDGTGTTGTISRDGDAVVYDPNGQFEALRAGETDTDSFTYTISDGNGGTATGTATVTVTGVNDAPVAINEVVITDEESPLSVDALANDTDPEGQVLSVDGIDDTGTIGKVVLSEGEITYDPDGQFEFLSPGEFETDLFAYTVSDGEGGLTTAFTTVVVFGFNDAPEAADDEASTDQNTEVVIDVLVNDMDVDISDTRTVTAIGQSLTAGAVTLVDGVVTYDPDGAFDALAVGETGTDSFAYTVTDSNGATDTASVTVTVLGLNDAPVAVADTFTTDEDTAVSGFNPAANDTDIDGDTLTVTAIDADGVIGDVTLGADGSVSYDPTGRFDTLGVGETATESFSYTVSDGNGGTATETVTVTVVGRNDAPVANDDTAATDEDTILLALPLLGNDTDPDGDPLAVTSLDRTGTAGRVTLNADGSVDYDPTAAFQDLGAGETATDSFGYTISDGQGGTGTARVLVTVTGVNDAPVAADDTATTAESGPAFVIDVLANDADVDGDPLLIEELDTDGTLGLVTLDLDGAVQYDPNGAFDGLAPTESATDTFTYAVSDGLAPAETATVTVTIFGENTAPRPEDDTASTEQETPVNLTTLLDNDSDPEGDPLTLTAVNNDGTRGTTTLEQDGSVSYDPSGAFASLAEGETGTDSFTYTVSDPAGATGTATVSVTITGVNDVPVAADDVGATLETAIITSLDVLGNDTDPDGDPLMIVAIDDAETLGLVTINGDGTLQYDPDTRFLNLEEGATTTDVFSYTVSDPSGATTSAEVTITVTGENTAPVTTTDAVLTDEDGVIVVDPLLNDTDPEGNALRLASVDGAGTLGAVSLTEDGTVMYDPAGAFAGLEAGQTAMDSFSYEVIDSLGATSRGEATIIIDGKSDLGITGTGDADILAGTSADDMLQGLAGRDWITASSGNDTVFGGLDQDIIEGAEGDDILDGGFGADVVVGGAGSDALFGSDGNDLLVGDLMAVTGAAVAIDPDTAG